MESLRANYHYDQNLEVAAKINTTFLYNGNHPILLVPIVTIPLSLDAMSTQEKIKMMELIWDDLCHSADVIPSPDWHESILKDRHSDLEKGEVSFIDWQLAKEIVRTNVHED